MIVPDPAPLSSWCQAQPILTLFREQHRTVYKLNVLAGKQLLLLRLLQSPVCPRCCSWHPH